MRNLIDLIQTYSDNFVYIKEVLTEIADKNEKLEKENKRLTMNLSTLQGNMNTVLTILKDLLKKDWNK